MVGNYVDNKIQNRRPPERRKRRSPKRCTCCGRTSPPRWRTSGSADWPNARPPPKPSTQCAGRRRCCGPAAGSTNGCSPSGSGSEPSPAGTPSNCRTAAGPRPGTGCSARAARRRRLVQGVPGGGRPAATVGRSGIAGQRAAAVGVARGVVTQLVALHSPADVVVAAFVSGDTTADWEWLKWLPHNRSRVFAGRRAATGQRGGGGPAAGVRARGVDHPAHHRVGRVRNLGDLPGGRRRSSRILRRWSDPAWSAWRRAGPAAGVHVVWVAGIAGATSRRPAATLCRVDGSGSVAAGFVTSGSACGAGGLRNR